jgi:hypothetical protein
MTNTMPPLPNLHAPDADEQVIDYARTYAEQVTKELRAEVEWLTEDRDQRRTDNEAMEAIVFGRYSNKDANAILTEARDVYVSIRERAERAEAEVERLRASKPEPDICQRCGKAVVNGRGGCKGAQHGNKGCRLNNPYASKPAQPANFIVPQGDVIGITIQFEDGHKEKAADVIEELLRYRAEQPADTANAASKPEPAQEPAAAVESLKAVLCDPDGRVCINGSDGDRNVIQDALAALSRQASQPAQEPVARLLTYVGKGTYPKRGYTVARTYEELSEGTYPESWAEGQRLYAAPLSDTAKQHRIMELADEYYRQGYNSLASDEAVVLARAALEAEVRKP